MSLSTLLACFTIISAAPVTQVASTSIEIEKLYVDRPIGVPLSRKALYDPNKDFTCLDGSAKVPFGWVNDDYCDCVDGSDEPGTSACERGRFHCVNLGHSPMNLMSSRVNDGICDCCDGSDEYRGIVTCPNVCDEIGKQARIEAEQRALLLKEGYKRRQEMAKEGQSVKTTKQKEIDVLKKEKEELEPQKDALNLAKLDAEKKETDAKDKFRENWEEEQKEKKKKEGFVAFALLDINKDNKISIEEITGKKEFDKDVDGTVTNEEAKEHLKDKEEVDLDTFLNEIWEDLRRYYRPMSDDEKKDDTTPSPDEATPIPPPPPVPTTVPPPSLDDVTVPPGEDSAEEKDEGEEEVEGDEVEDFDSEKYMKDGEKDKERQLYEDDPMPDYDQATKEIIEMADKARNEYNDLDSKYNDVSENIKKHEEFLTRDYGEDMAFASLDGKCFDFQDSQYTYRLCLYSKCTQSPKAGGRETSLGNWGEWTGPAENKYSRQLYSKGESCWNGPERSTAVKLVCGAANKLVAASEPGRCEYEFVFETPAVCNEPLPPGHPDHEL